MKRTAANVSRTLRPYVDTLLLATAIAQVERERCDAIQRRLLGTGSYGGDGEPRYTYTLPDEAQVRYHADLDAAYREAGYKDLKPGHCPALIAEHTQREGEWALIAAAEQFFPGVTNDKLLCGTADKGGLETRREYIDLLIKLVVNAPGYKSPLAR